MSVGYTKDAAASIFSGVRWYCNCLFLGLASARLIAVIAVVAPKSGGTNIICQHSEASIICTSWERGTIMH